MKPFQTWRYFAKFVSGRRDMNVRIAIWSLAWLSLFSATLQLALPRAFAADTDGDGLLDLIDVPGFDPHAAGTLQFLRRGIQDLDGANLLANATNLYLDRNGITSIEGGNFAGLDNLQTLGLNDNQIISIENGAFAGLGNLQELRLSSNRITDIERGALAGLDNLQRLFLESNRITSIESGDFIGLNNLQQLGLDGNQLTSIESGDFTGLDNLVSLSLSGNQITNIESGAFQGLKSLRTLDLRGSSITQLNLSSATFDSLPPCYIEEAEPSRPSSGFCIDSSKMTNVILDDVVLSLGSFEAIIGETRFVTSASLVGLTFSGTAPVNMSRLLGIPTLDNVKVDKALFERYTAEFNAFDALPGNSVTVVPEPSAIGLLGMGLFAVANAKRHRRAPGERRKLFCTFAVSLTH